MNMIDKVKDSETINELLNALRREDAIRALPERLKATLKPRLKSALDSTSELAGKINWKIVAFGIAAGAAAYLLRSTRSSRGGKTSSPRLQKPQELHRWENEGGMIATSVPATSH